jgi:putative endonuclease
MTAAHQFGSQGEQLVARKLEAQGFTIVEQNYRQRYGEIDLIASKASLLVFVEVKARKSALFDPTTLVTPTKQEKIIAVAQAYLVARRLDEHACRFDIAVVTATQPNPHIVYIADAFCAS